MSTTKRDIGSNRRNIGRSIRGSAVNVGVRAVISIGIIPLALNRAGAGGLGGWATLSGALVIATLADAGVGTESVRRIANARGRAPQREARLSLAMLGMSAVTIAAAGVLAREPVTSFLFPSGVAGYSHDQLVLFVVVTALSVGAAVVDQAPAAALRGLQRSDLHAWASIAGSIVGAVVAVGGLYRGAGLGALVAGMAVELALQFAADCLALAYLAGPLALVPRIDGSMMGMLGLSSLAFISVISDAVDSQWDKIVVSHFVGAEAVAQLHVATAVGLQAKALCLLPVVPLLSAVAEFTPVDPAAEERVYQQLTRRGLVLALPTMTCVIAFSPALIRTWLGALMVPAGFLAQVFAGAVLLNVLVAPAAMRAIGRSWHRDTALASAINIAVNGIASILLVELTGTAGAVVGSVLGNAAGFASFYVLLHRRTRRWELPPMLPLGVSAAACTVLILFGSTRINSWAPLLAGGAATFAGLTLVTGYMVGFRLSTFMPARQ